MMRRWWRRLCNRLRWGRVSILRLRPGDVIVVYVPGALSENRKYLVMETFRAAVERAGHRHVEVIVLDDTVSVNVLTKQREI